MDLSPAGRPARGRYGILALLCTLAMITYLDRVCFGTAAGPIAKELGISREAVLQGPVTAFALSYAIFEIPSGWIGDMLGPGRTLFRIVLVWSACTAATGAIGWRLGGSFGLGLGALTAIRFAFGAGEAGAFPNITRALHNWFPVSEWSTAQGLIWMSGRIMGGLTPLLWWLLVEPHGVSRADGAAAAGLVSWRGAFAIFGVLGLGWCALFRLTFRDRPASAAVLADSPPGADSQALPWRCFLTNANLWAICLMYFGTSYGWYFNITYLPTYLDKRFQLPADSTLGALYKGGPLWVGAAGCLIGGLLADRLGRRLKNRQRARMILGVAGHSLSALCWMAVPFVPNAHLFFITVSATALFNDLTLASAWSTCQDIGGRYTAVTAAWMNTIGTLGAAAAGWLTGWLVETASRTTAAALNLTVEALPADVRLDAELSGYQVSFWTYAGMYLLTAFLWTRIDSSRLIVPEERLATDERR